MSIQQRRIRQVVGGLENVKLVRLKSSTRHCKSIRGKPPLSIKAQGPAHNPEYACYEVVTTEGQGISKWEVVARGDVADLQTALLRILR